MNRNIFKILICFFLVSLITGLSGCGKKGDDTSSVPAGNSVSTPISDEQDPENTDFDNDTGAQVNANDLYHQSGKANGIDVSKWQGKIDWESVKSTGIDFAVIRIGYRGNNGTIYKDAYADYNIQQADKAGLLIGVYFFSTATNKEEAEEEAKWTVSAISGYSISYPVVYDCENFKSAESRMYNVGNMQRTDNALAFLKYVSDSGYEGMFYAAKSEVEASGCWDTERIESTYKIWVARYPAVPYPQTPSPDYSGKYDMWQYTNMGKVGGIVGNTDMIVSYFTREKATPKNASAAPGAAAAPSADDGIYTAANESVTAKELTNLRDAATTKSNIVATLKNGELATRTGIGSNGWSKLSYDGKTVYAITSYLTTDTTYKAPATESIDEFKAAGGQVTAKDETNLRSSPSTDGEKIAAIKNGDMVTRTGESSSGWTRVIYNGQTVYAKTSLLTTEVKQPTKETEPTTPPVSDGFKAVNDSVTAKDITNLRSSPSSSDGVEIVYQLKNGERVQRTGINEASGWSKLVFNGQTVYAISSYLTTDGAE